MPMQFFQDWIYPIVDLIIKIGAGIIVAYYLSRRGWRDKRKEKLIEAYVEFLAEIGKIFEHAFESCTETFWRLFISKLTENTSDPTYVNRIDDLIKTRKKLKAGAQNESELLLMGIFTYKFAFLMGKKYYFKHVMPAERTLSEFLVNNRYKHDIALNVFGETGVRENFAKLLKYVAVHDFPAIERDLQALFKEIDQLIGTRIRYGEICASV
jgi:hypothetical protein